MNTHQQQRNISTVPKPKRYTLPELHTVVHTSFRDSNGVTGARGTIFARRVKSLAGIFYIHYGLFYGIDQQGTTWVIESNPEGIVCITMEDFSQGLAVSYSFVNLDRTNGAEIMRRVMQRVGIPYNADNNNCETFVQYAVFARLKSFQSDNTRNLADVLLSGFELYASLDNKNYGIPHIMSAVRSKLNIPRMPELDTALQKIGESNGKQNLSDYAQLMKQKPGVIHKVVKGRLTFYSGNRRIVIMDENRTELFVKLPDYTSQTLTYGPRTVTYPVPGLKGCWVRIDLSMASDWLCRKLLDEVRV